MYLDNIIKEYEFDNLYEQKIEIVCLDLFPSGKLKWKAESLRAIASYEYETTFRGIS